MYKINVKSVTIPLAVIAVATEMDKGGQNGTKASQYRSQLSLLQLTIAPIIQAYANGHNTACSYHCCN